MTNTASIFTNRPFIGFDTKMMNDFLNGGRKNSTYPPHNIVQNNSDEFEIQIATAGFSAEELEISHETNKLTVEGKSHSDKNEDAVYYHRGLSMRDFTLEFALAQYVEPTSITYENGILKIVVRRELPPEKQQRKLKINT